MFDTSPYFYPSDSHSIEDSDMDTFSGLTDDLPFISTTEQELQTSCLKQEKFESNFCQLSETM